MFLQILTAVIIINAISVDMLKQQQQQQQQGESISQSIKIYSPTFVYLFARLFACMLVNFLPSSIDQSNRTVVM